MKDYFRNDIKISIDFEEYKEVLKEQFGEEFPISTYDSRLIYNQKKPEHLQLTIYYTHTDYLYEKLEFLKEKGICIFQTIKPKPKENQWEYPDKLDFSESNLISIEESHYWEHNKKPVVLTIDNLNILINSRYVGDGRFQLSENVFQHIDEYIQYGGLGRHNYDDRFIEKDDNREINFGLAKFILSFEHFYENDTIQKLSILRDAYLTITDSTEKLTDTEIIELGNSLCLLMSFFWQKSIGYFIARVRVIDLENYRTKEILRYSDLHRDETQDFLLKERYNTFYDFVEVINYEKFQANSALLNELVPRIIKIKNVDEISAFMILYNIIEKIRNFCLSNHVNDKKFTIKEEFDFTKGKKSTNTFIKNKIKEIKEIVEESDIEDFERKASDKVTFIKKTGLIDQFDSLLSYLELDLTHYKINFTNLIKIRNDIYHGKLPKEDVKPYNEQMTVIIYDMILKMIIN